MSEIKVRKKKSLRLSEAEHKKFNDWVYKQETKYDASLIIGCTLPTMDRIQCKGSGSELIITKIKQILSKWEKI